MSASAGRLESYDQIVKLIHERCGVKIEKIQECSRLESDLGVYGDDAYYLLAAMEMDLKVDMSSFSAGDFITPELAHFSSAFVFGLLWLGYAIVINGLLPHLVGKPAITPLSFVLAGATIVIRHQFGSWSKPARPELLVSDLVTAMQYGKWKDPERKQERQK